MSTFFATFLLFGLVVSAMAIGVIFSNRRLKGSCGGPGGNCDCSIAKRAGCPRRGNASAP